MNLETIQEGEELLKSQTINECNVLEIRYRTRDGVEHAKHWPDTTHVEFFLNHASELLQSAREVERLNSEIVRLENNLSGMQHFQFNAEGHLYMICPKCKKEHLSPKPIIDSSC